jgi:hypothetical protein
MMGDRLRGSSVRHDFHLVAAPKCHQSSSGMNKGKPMNISRKDLLGSAQAAGILGAHAARADLTGAPWRIACVGREHSNER